MEDVISELDETLENTKKCQKEENLNYEKVIQNLRGHMLNIYTGNISPEMELILNAAVKIQLRKQKFIQK